MGLKVKADIRGAERKTLVDYLKAEQELKDLEKVVKVLKARAINTMEQSAKGYKEGEKSSYVYTTVQVGGATKAIVYTKTIAKGTIDWETAYYAKGGTAAEAERYRRDSNTRTKVTWATDAQCKELGL